MCFLQITKDISPGDEVVVDYGDQYWTAWLRLRGLSRMSRLGEPLKQVVETTLNEA